MYGPAGIVHAAGLGLLRVANVDGGCEANVVPVDMCINGLIASAWDIAEKFKRASEENLQFEIPVYHYENFNDKVLRIRALYRMFFLSLLEPFWGKFSKSKDCKFSDSSSDIKHLGIVLSFNFLHF